MPDELTVTQINDASVGGMPGWVFVCEGADGFVHHHAVPAIAIAARAIEYGMDEDDDFDGIVDIVLHEPFLQGIMQDDPAVAEGYVTTDATGQQVAGDLWTAETIQDAREAHQLRIRKAKRTTTTIVLPDEQRHKLSAKEKKLRKASREELKQHRAYIAEERRRVRGRKDGKPLKG